MHVPYLFHLTLGMFCMFIPDTCSKHACCMHSIVYALHDYACSLHDYACSVHNYACCKRPCVLHAQTCMQHAELVSMKHACYQHASFNQETFMHNTQNAGKQQFEMYYSHREGLFTTCNNTACCSCLCLYIILIVTNSHQISGFFSLGMKYLMKLVL